jgi:4-carboxymuconolactone decarboxylase
MNDELRKKTQDTAKQLFGKGIKLDPPYMMWKEFDKDLANDFSYLSPASSIPERF